ncbi:uncharacterized protein LOC102801114, partial [Saccoglossus kowalevskii]|uniref:Uncharacterized protein LOC102801114 n=1 Tax=Saccoglossus kowalevskii TaxID=10224 RepID=A0ABM0M4G1_SACKO
MRPDFKQNDAMTVMRVASTTNCDVQQMAQTCVMSRDVGSDASFEVEIDGDYVAGTLQWYKYYVGLPPHFHSYQQRLTAPGGIDENMHLTENGKRLTISPIKDDDFYETKYWAELSAAELQTQAIAQYEIDDDLTNPRLLRVYFIIQNRPVDFGPFLPGDSLHINLADHITIPKSAMEFVWKKMVSPLKYISMEKPENNVLDIQYLNRSDFGIISVQVYGSKENIPGRVQTMEKNFNIALDETKSCSRYAGHIQCQCNSGYHGDGYQCADINECIHGSHHCVTMANCVNTLGSYNCVCPPGYQGDGRIECTDVDECSQPHLHNCDINAKCTNTEGSYSCECTDDYLGNGFDCL